MATETRTTPRPRPARPANPEIPPLEGGDRLTRPEFERRYDAMPHLKKAELIEGIVYMGSPVSYSRHGGPHVDVSTLAGLYRASTPGVHACDNGSVRLDLENVTQPDVFLFLDASLGGQARISEDDYIEGAPELVIEVASSSASYDLHQKKRVYQRHGVREYIVWRTRDEAIDWFGLREGQFEPLAKTAEGHYQSEVFPGLWLDPEALLRGDLAAVVALLQRGLASPEHAVFVDRLRQQGAARRESGSQGEPRP